MDDFGKVVTIIRRLFFCGSLPMVKSCIIGFPEFGIKDITSLLAFSGDLYPLMCCVWKLPCGDVSLMLISVGLNT